MTTTTTVPAVSPIHFGIPGYSFINSDPRAQRILASVPAFAELRDSYANTARGMKRPPAPDFDRVIAAYRDGGDLAELAADAAAEQSRYEAVTSAAQRIEHHAQIAHDNDVTEFLRTHRPEFNAAILLEYEEIKAAAIELLPELGEHDSVQEAASSEPERVAAWGRFLELTANFDAWRTVAAGLAERPYRENMFAGLDVLADYGEAWPRFFMLKGFITKFSEGRVTTSMAELPPWQDTVSLLRDIATRDLPMWAPSLTEIDVARERLQAAASDLIVAEQNKIRGYELPRDLPAVHVPLIRRD